MPIVFVVDDDISVREALEALIAQAGWRAETFASVRDFLAHRRDAAPSCLILDISLPGLDDLRDRIGGVRVEIPTIFVTNRGDVATTVCAMKAGAVDFLTKPFDGDILLDAIGIAIARSETAIGLAETGQALHRRYDTLSRREREVMALVVSGLMNKQVGGDLGISEITVKAHRGKVMRKMGARSLAELVRMAGSLAARD